MAPKKMKCEQCGLVFFNPDLLRNCKRNHKKFKRQFVKLLHRKFCKAISEAGHDDTKCDFYRAPGRAFSHSYWHNVAVKILEFGRKRQIMEIELIELFNSL